jgi:hypothetical protein
MSAQHIFGEAKAFDASGIVGSLGDGAITRAAATNAASSLDLRAVGLIVKKDAQNLDDDPVAIGSCVLVGREWVLTAHHVLLSQEFAQNFKAVFNFINTNAKSVSDEFSKVNNFYFSAKEGDFYCSKDGVLSENGHEYMAGDWALIKVTADKPHDISPLKPRKVVAADVQADSRRFFVPYHQTGYSPLGSRDIPFGLAPVHALITDRASSIFKDTQRIAAYDPADWKIEHYAAAHSGASGAPLMSIDGEFVGIHLRSLKKASGINPGLACSARAIAEILKNENILQNDPSFTLKLANFP